MTLSMAQENANIASNSSEKIANSAEDDIPVIVVIGKRPRPIEDVFGSASVITRNTLDEQLSQDLLDATRYQTGISVEFAGSRFGQSGISIRGIGGNRVAMEVDSVPMSDQFSIGSYSYAGRNLIELDNFQQIEILKGPASSIYGSDAIGGVVNFISRKPNDLLSETQEDFYVGVKSAYKSADNSKSINVQAAVPIDKLSVLASITQRSGDELSHQTSSDLQDNQQSSSNTSLMLYGIYDINPNHQLGLRYQEVERSTESNMQSLLGIERFESTTALLGDDESNSQTLSLHYDFMLDRAVVDGGVARLYQQSSDIQQFTLEDRVSRGNSLQFDRRFYFEQDLVGARLNLYSNVYGKNVDHEFGYGLELSRTKVEELRDSLQTNLNTGATTNIILSEDFPLRDFPNSTIDEYGFYVNDQITILNSKLSVIPAIRYDNYHLKPKSDSIYLADNPASTAVAVKANHWTPKLGLLYEFSANAEVYLQYSEGFRAPPFEDANIGLDIPMFNIRAIPNPNLKAETSKGYELGFNYKNAKHAFEWVLFHTDYKDFIQTKVNLGFDPVSGRVLFQSQNLDSASIYGSELNYSYFINDAFTVNTSAFWNKGENKVNQQALNETQPHQLLASVIYQHQAFRASLILTHTDAKNDLDKSIEESLFEAPSYTTLDVLANYDVNRHLQISASISNITDEAYWPWATVNGLLATDPLLDVLSAPGREFSVQLKYSW